MKISLQQAESGWWQVAIEMPIEIEDYSVWAFHDERPTGPEAKSEAVQFWNTEMDKIKAGIFHDLELPDSGYMEEVVTVLLNDVSVPVAMMVGYLPESQFTGISSAVTYIQGIIKQIEEL